MLFYVYDISTCSVQLGQEGQEHPGLAIGLKEPLLLFGEAPPALFGEAPPMVLCDNIPEPVEVVRCGSASLQKSNKSMGLKTLRLRQIRVLLKATSSGWNMFKSSHQKMGSSILPQNPLGHWVRVTYDVSFVHPTLMIPEIVALKRPGAGLWEVCEPFSQNQMVSRHIVLYNLQVIFFA